MSIALALSLALAMFLTLAYAVADVSLGIDTSACDSTPPVVERMPTIHSCLLPFPLEPGLMPFANLVKTTSREHF
jgi:hypothetical protein